jgi:galactokinase
VTAGVEERLAAAGMSQAECVAKGRLFEDASRAVEATGRSAAGPPISLFVPGRIEVFGKHTDYAGGRSLLCTVERGFCLVARPRPDAHIRIVDAGSGEAAACDLDPDLVVTTGHWSGYPMTVARRLARNFPLARSGADIGFVSDLPPAAGMSSSSALLTAVFLALAAINDLAARETYRREIRTLEDLAGFLGTIENGQSFGALDGDRGVGTFGGSEDHTAMLCCQPGCLSQYRFCPVRRERVVALPARVRFVIAVSGVIAEKTGAARERYNRVSLAARAALDVWRAATGRADRSLAEAAGSTPDAPARMREILAGSAHPVFPPAALLDRFEQFLTESTEIIPAAAEALARGDLGTVGTLADRSQRGAEEWLGTQVPETVMLARAAREEGALAASAFGAGFGGSVWAMVYAEGVEAFADRWETRYRAAFPGTASRARFIASPPGPPAVRL